jgi:hypothetical protein
MRGEVADQEDDGMAQILQLAHLVEHHGVPDVDVGCGRVQAQLDAQRNAGGLGTGQLAHPVAFGNQLFAATQSHRQ